MRNRIMLTGLLLAIAGPVHADESTTVTAPSRYVERVPYQASALANDEGVRDLRSRVRHAVHNVCQPSKEGVLWRSTDELNCFHLTFSDSQAQVDRVVAQARQGGIARAASIAVSAR